jgi:hypothetical protein
MTARCLVSRHRRPPQSHDDGTNPQPRRLHHQLRRMVDAAHACVNETLVISVKAILSVREQKSWPGLRTQAPAIPRPAL